MYGNKRTPLPATAKDAYNILLDYLDDPEEGITPDELYELLLDEDFPPADADYAIDKLLKRGYFYEIDGELFITDLDE